MAEIKVDDDILLRWPTMVDAEDIFTLVRSKREHLGGCLPWVENGRRVEDERQWVQGRIKAQEEHLGKLIAILIQQG
ncbi:MAG: hypothetical protein QGI09_07205 [Dehalococcoidia bacterium]|nr:hypothetical protein [Dehalococcoidia bacterium]